MNQTITLPGDVPPGVREMLAVTIREAWEDYEGDRNSPESFWDFLVGT